MVSRDLQKLSKSELESFLEQRRLDGSGKVHKFYTWEPYKRKNFGDESFQHKMLRCKAKTIALIGGNRIGKTETGARLVVSRCLGFDPFYDGIKNRLKCSYEIPQRWWVCTEPDLVEGLFNTLREMIPPAEIKKIRESKAHQDIQFVNASLIEMKSFAQKRKAYQGARLNGVWIDEEEPEHIYLELKTRLIDLGGTLLRTLTPVEGTTWLHEKLFGLNDTPQGRRCYGRMSGKFAWFTGKMRENPYLSEADVESYIEEFKNDEDALAIRIEGNYKLLAGENAFGTDNLAYALSTVCEPVTFGIFDENGSLVETKEAPSNFKIWETRAEGHGYVIGVDPAMGGERSDNSAVSVKEVQSGRTVATLCGQIEPSDLAHMVYCAGQYYNQALIVVEINNHGALVQTKLRDMKYPEHRFYRRIGFTGRIHNVLETFGWRTDKTSKPLMVSEYRSALSQKITSVRDEDAVAEMSGYVVLKKNLPGYHGYGPSSKKRNDDRLTAEMLAWQGLKQMSMYTSGSEVLRARDAALATRERIKAERDRLLADDFEMDIDEFIG
jgi:phage terminase large subunit-like protein